VISATPITAEKEARTWPILLLTPLSETQILLGKAVGVLRRSLPVWVLLLGHAAFFVAIDLLAPVVILHLAMLAGWITLFLTGSGLFFSSCFKRTTTAVVANLALCAVIWAAMPLVLYVLCERSPLMRTFPDLYVTGNPVVQAVVTNSGWKYGMHPFGYTDFYSWPDRNLTPSKTTERMVKWSLLYVAAGVGFAFLARRRIRAKVF
jgi:ABC-type Na+ efflux pump permease subunit